MHLAESVVIENALVIVTQKGVGPALEYMFDNGIPPQVAYRVLGSPEFQRHNNERRKAFRSEE